MEHLVQQAMLSNGVCFSITPLCLNAVPNLICILLRICVCKFNRLIIVLDHFRCNSQIITYRRVLLNWFEATLRHVHVTPFSTLNARSIGSDHFELTAAQETPHLFYLV